MNLRPEIFTIIGLVLLPFAASSAVFYVNVNNATPSAPYSNWTTAATNIQDAIDAASDADLVLVTNGLYNIGSRLTSDGTQNRLVIKKTLTLQSLNGPTATSIDGGKAVRCVYLTNGAAVSGFTITNGKAAIGGGVFCASVKEQVLNCQIIKNSASSGGGCYQGTLTNCLLAGNMSGNAVGNGGGGAYGSVLYKCILSGNSTGANTANNGGGAYFCTLSFCTINNNAASQFGYGGGVCNCTVNNCALFGNTTIGEGFGGGAGYSTLNTCVIYGNYPDGVYRGTAFNCTITGNTYLGAGNCNAYNCIIYGNGPADNSGGILAYCCTRTLQPGEGNISSAPNFINAANSDYHLQFNSPCINSGKNAYVTGINDLDGRPRIVSNTVDIGAYEYQGPFNAWLQQYGLLTNGTADYADPDGDGQNNWQEWIARTIPTNATSVLQMSSPSNSVSGVTVTWQSVSGVTYYLQSSTNLSVPPAFVSIQSNLVGQADSTSYTDTTATNAGPYFYRVGVQ